MRIHTVYLRNPSTSPVVLRHSLIPGSRMVVQPKEVIALPRPLWVKLGMVRSGLELVGNNVDKPDMVPAMLVSDTLEAVKHLTAARRKQSKENKAGDSEAAGED